AARNTGSRLDLDIELAVTVLAAESYSTLAVENDRNISPDALLPIVPVRPIPNVARLATKFNCEDDKGASVPTMIIIEPSCCGFSTGSKSVISFPTGTPAMTKSGNVPKLR